MIVLITLDNGAARRLWGAAKGTGRPAIGFSTPSQLSRYRSPARVHYKPVRCTESVGIHTSEHSSLTSQRRLSCVSGDLMDNREYGLWTLPRLWKTREARAARVACRLGEVVSCLPTQPRRFPQSLGKRSRVSHERPQAPPEIDTRRICFIGIRKRNRLVEAMENALPGFEESLLVAQRLEPSQPSGAFPTASRLVYLTCGGLILERIH